MKRMITYRDALVEAQSQEMERDNSVFVYGLDVQDHKKIFGSTATLLEKFGAERVFGVPLSEDALMGIGVGAAINGMRPINVHIRVDFLLLAMNQISNMVSNYRYITDGKLKVPLVIRAVIGRGWGQGAQHSKTLHSFFAHIPGLKVVMPTTSEDAKGLLIASIREDNPVIFLEHRWLYDVPGEVESDPDKALIPLGVGKKIREGKDATIIATSWMNVEALKASDILHKKQGVEIEIIDPRTIEPLDEKIIIDSVEKTKHAIVADYDWINCGFSAEVAARIQEKCLRSLQSPVTRLGFAKTPCPTTRPLENKFYPNAIDIIQAVEQKLGLSPTDITGEEFYSYEKKFKGQF